MAGGKIFIAIGFGIEIGFSKLSISIPIAIPMHCMGGGGE
jgi:hypothetical protein